jgi:hypothetical protein
LGVAFRTRDPKLLEIFTSTFEQNWNRGYVGISSAN